MTNYAIEYLDLDNPDVSLPVHRATVLYGTTGKRKTTGACEMILDRGILVSADNSWIVLQKNVHKDLRKKVKLVKYEGLSQLEYLDVSGDVYDTIILDTTTAMVDSYLDMLYKEASWGGKYRETISSKHPDLRGLSTTAPIDYKVTRDIVRPIVLSLVKAPVHVIFTMHVNHPLALSKNPNPKDLMLRPRLPEATWGVIAEQSNIIGYIDGTDNAKGFKINMDEKSSLYVGKSQIEGISGQMDLDRFIRSYKETL
jgi:hypothetical protein